MTIKELEKHLQGVTSKKIEKEINRLDVNLAAMKSSGTTIIDLKTFKKVRDTQKSLIEILRIRHGQEMPFEFDKPAD